MENMTSFNSTSNNYHLPRNISGGLKTRIILGSPLFIAGFFVFLFTMIFPIVFSTQMDFKDAFAFSDNDPLSPGVVTDRTSTNAKVNNGRVYEYSYEFKTADGKSFSGSSFSSTSGAGVGDTVMIQYVKKDPATSQIQGMSKSVMPVWILPFLFIFPVVGLLLVIGAFIKGKKNIFLVKNGILTTGKVTRKERTNTRINNSYVYKVFFQFKSQDGNQQEAFVKTHKLDRILDEKEERLVYDPNKPTQAMLIDALPKQVRKFFEGM